MGFLSLLMERLDDRMKKLVDDKRLIFKCCSLYYLDGLGQKEVADALGISRPTVSRLLQLGKDTGIVKIEVLNPDNTNYGQMERELEKKFSLQEVIIVDSMPLEQGTRNINSEIGSATLEYLSRILKDDYFVGISMGLTIQNIVRSEYRLEKSCNCTFVPLIGGVSESRMDIHSNYLAREFAERFGGKSVQFFAPALFSRKDILEGFMEERSNRKVTNMYTSLDVVLMGIGVLDPAHSTLLQEGYIDQSLMQEFLGKGAVGDIALRYFDANGGAEAFSDFNERVAGISLRRLAQVPRRIGVACGKPKIAPVLGAIRGRYINILITDTECAAGLLASE